jgi:hypothetical protein
MIGPGGDDGVQARVVHHDVSRCTADRKRYEFQKGRAMRNLGALITSGNSALSALVVNHRDLWCPLADLVDPKGTPAGKIRGAQITQDEHSVLFDL